MNEYQRQKLRDFSSISPGNTYQKLNPALEKYLEELKYEAPKAFHLTVESLKERVFVDTPVTIPASMYKRAIRSWDQSPRRAAA
jgi:hypothetical protein